ncbi:hypothetical protein HHK36_009979 [Tetracentron sinense]|uniref:Sodium channel modifier 1 n=1 Tax=Tetracentron sinense TaxID=13715 RepID=A0A834ZML0_TETSI|nr:hypothetical protein HHK36_009979 [Tetracentron sinense]
MHRREREREMSVFGGDSWGREAQQRKRRVDDLLEQSHDGTSFQKLSSGKFACLVCPHNPVLDSSLMLSMHNKGSRHLAAESRLKERELMRLEEINKRVALLDGSTDAANSCTSTKRFKLASKPLIEQTRNAASETLSNKALLQNATNKHRDMKLSRGNASFFASNSTHVPKPRMESPVMGAGPSSSNDKNCIWATEASNKMLIQHQLEFRERRERELKFTAAGWKRDGFGNWFRDENVEFDSDEEDPNVSLT